MAPAQVRRRFPAHTRRVVQHDVVAVAGQFVVVPATLDPDVDATDPGQLRRQHGEEVRAYHELLFGGEVTVDHGAQIRGGDFRLVAAESHLGVEAPKQVEVADVP